MPYTTKRVFAIFNDAGEVVITFEKKPRKKELERMLVQLERKQAHETEPKECPDKSGRVAPVGQHWVRNIISGDWVLEACGTPWSCSVASETYWSA